MLFSKSFLATFVVFLVACTHAEGSPHHSRHQQRRHTKNRLPRLERTASRLQRCHQRHGIPQTTNSGSTSRPSPANLAVGGPGSPTEAGGDIPWDNEVGSEASNTTNTPAGNPLSALFPVPTIQQSWTTVPNYPNSVPLSDETFRLYKLIKTLSHDYIPAPDGKLSMEAHFPQGSYTFGHSPQGGLSFYAPGPASVDLTTAKEVTFGYALWFEEGFAFNKGGKLPGLCKLRRADVAFVELIIQLFFFFCYF